MYSSDQEHPTTSLSARAPSHREQKGALLVSAILTARPQGLRTAARAGQSGRMVWLGDIPNLVPLACVKGAVGFFGPGVVPRDAFIYAKDAMAIQGTIYIW